MCGRRAALVAPEPRTTLVVVVMAFLFAACGAGTDSGNSAPTPSPAALQAVIVGSELLVGDQRFPVGILDQNTPVNDATVHVRAFFVVGNNAQLKSESDAPFRGAQLEGKGLYVAHLTFDRAGQSGAEITAQRPDGEHGVMRLPLDGHRYSGRPSPRAARPTQPQPDREGRRRYHHHR